MDNYGSISVVSEPTYASRFTGGTTCPNCLRPFAVTITPQLAGVSTILTYTTHDQLDENLNKATIEYFPKDSGDIYNDDALPEKIREAFIFVQEDAFKRRNPTGILSGARACLDVALKALGETNGGRRERIQALAEKKIITQKIADWAQTLWEDGSDAVHDLDANIDRAVEHVDFLKLFFEVCFSLPARISTASHGTVDGALEATEN